MKNPEGPRLLIFLGNTFNVLINSKTKNTLYNLVGQIVPMLAGLVTIPYTIKYLGADKLGIIILAWLFLGYSGIFDLGLSRALTQVVSEKLGEKRTDEIPSIFWTSFYTVLILSLFGTLVIGAGIGAPVLTLNRSSIYLWAILKNIFGVLEKERFRLCSETQLSKNDLQGTPEYSY
jgi:O-antigen/teichoic acid export membrane protein